MSSRRRVEACDSWRPPRSHGGPAILLRAGPRLPAFASLSVSEGGEAAAVATAVEEAVGARAGEGREEQRAAAAAGAEDASGRKERRRLPPAARLARHPLALLALVPHGAALFAAGAAAGAAAKTVTAPLDRVKILMQVGTPLSLSLSLAPVPRSSSYFCRAGVWLTGFSLLCSPLQTHSVRVAGESAKKAVGFLEVAMRSIASLSSI
jgi:hypothetical protein